MNEIARDYTPRVIHFDETFNELDVVAQEDVVWPCYSYKLALPVHSKLRLDIFEELVLTLAAQGMTDAGYIADFCYPHEDGTAKHPLRDVFFFVQSRLLGKGFLTDRFEPSETGKKLIEEWENETVEYRTAFVYQDRVSGGLLPCVNFNAAEYAEIGFSDEYSIKFKTEFTGKSIRARKINGNQSARWPTDREVERAFRQFKRRVSRYGTLRNCGFSIPDVEFFRPPIEKPELIYLHCHVLVQSGRADMVLVSDGFGMGYSTSFTEYLNKQSWSWITGLKEKGVVHDPTGESGKTAWLEKFSPVTSNLKKAREVFEKWNGKQITSTNEGNRRKNAVSDSVIALYAALEHTLATVCFKYPVSDWIKVFSSGTYDWNTRILRESAANIGFSITQENSFLLKAAPEVIRRASSGNAELQPLLVLSVMAANDEKRHPFHELAKKSRDIFNFLARLKKLRDSFSHGDYSIEISDREFEELLGNCENVISILLPHGVGEPVKERRVVVDSSPELSDYDQLCLKAEIALEKFFGLEALHFMDPDLKEILRRLEMPSYDNQITVLDLTAALQGALNAVLSAIRSQASPVVEKWAGEFERDLYGTAKAVKKYAHERAVRFSLLAPGDALPTSFESVGSPRVKLAIQGGSPSLQSVCVALLTIGPDDLLRSIARKTPEFLHTVDKMVKLRGHGNTPVLADETEIRKTKENIFTIIRSLMEVIDD